MINSQKMILFSLTLFDFHLLQIACPAFPKENPSDRVRGERACRLCVNGGYNHALYL